MTPQLPQTDPALQFLQFLSNFGGNKQTVTGGANIDPKARTALDTILAQQLSQITPEGATALINSIFQQGQKQAPVLAMQHAQSVGARTRGNAPLAMANERLMGELSAQAMAQLAGLQRDAASTAKGYADSTRSTSQTTTTKPSSTSMALMAAPFLLGQVGNLKKLGQGFGGLFESGGADTGFGSVPGGSGVADFVGNNPSAYVADIGSGGGDFVGPVLDGGNFDLGLSNFLEGIDAGFGTGDAFGNLDYGMFFADGGIVKKPASDNPEESEGRQQYLKSRPAAQQEQKPQAQPQQQTGQKSFGVRLFDYLQGRTNKFADGGQVKKSLTSEPAGYADGGSVRGSTVMPSSSGAATTATAINNPTVEGDEEPTSPTMQSNGLPDFSGDTLANDVLSFFSSQEISNSGWQPDPGLFQGKDGNFYSATTDAMSGPSGEAGYSGVAPKTTGIRQFAGGNPSGDWNSYQEGQKYDKTFNMDGSFRDIVYNEKEGNQFSDFLSFAAAAAGLAFGNPALAFARSIGTRTATDAVRTTLSPDRVSGSQLGGRDTRYASGGEVDGPGTSVSDSIPIRVSDGEYVVPADVVEALGVEFFDGLRSAFHTPVSMQQPQRG